MTVNNDFSNDTNTNGQTNLNNGMTVGSVYIDQFSNRNDPLSNVELNGSDSPATVKDVERLVSSVRNSFSSWIEIQRAYKDSELINDKKESSEPKFNEKKISDDSNKINGKTIEESDNSIKTSINNEKSKVIQNNQYDEQSNSNDLTFRKNFGIINLTESSKIKFDENLNFNSLNSIEETLNPSIENSKIISEKLIENNNKKNNNKNHKSNNNNSYNISEEKNDSSNTKKSSDTNDEKIVDNNSTQKILNNGTIIITNNNSTKIPEDDNSKNVSILSSKFENYEDFKDNSIKISSDESSYYLSEKDEENEIKDLFFGTFNSAYGINDDVSYKNEQSSLNNENISKSVIIKEGENRTVEISSNQNDIIDKPVIKNDEKEVYDSFIDLFNNVYGFGNVSNDKNNLSNNTTVETYTVKNDLNDKSIGISEGNVPSLSSKLNDTTKISNNEKNDTHYETSIENSNQSSSNNDIESMTERIINAIENTGSKIDEGISELKTKILSDESKTKIEVHDNQYEKVDLNFHSERIG